MTFARFFIVICVFVGFYGICSVYGQGDRMNSSKVFKAVNLFIVIDENNKVANRSVLAALNTTRVRCREHLGKVWTIQINEADVNDTLDRIRKGWNSAIEGEQTDAPNLVLDVTTAGVGAEIINTFPSALGIPVLSGKYDQEGELPYWRDLKPDEKRYLVQIMPPVDMTVEAVRHLVIKLNVTNAAILYDGNFVMDRKYKSLLLSLPIRHVIDEASQSIGDMRRQLLRLRNMDVVNYFVLGDGKTINVVLDAAESLNFNGRNYGWFMMTLEGDLKLRCKCKNMTVLVGQPETRYRMKRDIDDMLLKPLIMSGFYYDIALLGIRTMSFAMDNGDWPLEQSNVQGNSGNNSYATKSKLGLFDYLKKSYSAIVPTLGRIIWGTKNGEHRMMFSMVFRMVRIDNGAVLPAIDVALWKATIGIPLEVTSDEITSIMAQQNYRVATVIHPPFVMYDAEKDRYFGFCIDLLDKIKEIVGFEYEITETRPNEDKLSLNDTWAGMTKELIDKRADIALSSFWVTTEREKVVDFTFPYYDHVGLSIIMLKTRTTTSLFKFVTVLDNQVWLCILAVYTFTRVSLWAFDRWSPYSCQNNLEKREFNLRECFWFCATSLAPNGEGETPKNLSGRVIVATWWFFSFIIVASYTANLAAFLTVSRLEMPIESLDDLSEQNKIQYAPVFGSAAYIYFKRMNNIERRFHKIWQEGSLNDDLPNMDAAEFEVWDYPVSDKYTKLWKAMEVAGFPASTEEALRRVRRLDSTDDFAYIEDATTVKYLAMTNCDLIEVGDEFSRKPYAIAIQKGSPLKDVFNDALLLLLKKRELDKLKHKWWKNNPARKNCDTENHQSDGISIRNIGGVFIVIFLGITCAYFALIFQYLYYRQRGKVIKLKRNTSAKSKIWKIVKPIRFDVQPAPTRVSQTWRCRPKF